MNGDIVPGDVPDPWRDPDAPDVGDFRQGTPLGDAALRQYLLLRVLAASIQRTILWIGLTITALAVVLWFADHRLLAILVGVVGLGWLLVSRLVSAIIRRLSGSHRLSPSDEARVDDLVKETRRGLRGELRRVGLPSGPLGEFRVGIRLVRPFARVLTLRRLAGMKLESVLPASRLDELYFLLKQRGR